MSKPKAYDPQHGYKYQILCRHRQYNGIEWEHSDYATDRDDLKHLLTNLRQAYNDSAGGGGFEFKSILLPQKYWPPRKVDNPPGLPSLSSPNFL